jgi:regulator of replication initiation timing
MAGNTMSEIFVTHEEIASSLSTELQRAIVQVLTLRIENAKLKEKLNDLAKKSAADQNNF